MIFSTLNYPENIGKIIGLKRKALFPSPIPARWGHFADGR